MQLHNLCDEDKVIRIHQDGMRHFRAVHAAPSVFTNDGPMQGTELHEYRLRRRVESQAARKNYTRQVMTDHLAEIGAARPPHSRYRSRTKQLARKVVDGQRPPRRTADDRPVDAPPVDSAPTQLDEVRAAAGDAVADYADSADHACDANDAAVAAATAAADDRCWRCAADIGAAGAASRAARAASRAAAAASRAAAAADGSRAAAKTAAIVATNIAAHAECVDRANFLMDKCLSAVELAVDVDRDTAADVADVLTSIGERVVRATSIMDKCIGDMERGGCRRCRQCCCRDK